MIRFKIDQAKSFFFDRPVVQFIDNKSKRALSKAGAFVRTRARSLIRKVGKKGNPSAPGQPPKSRVGTLRKFLFFVYEPSSRSVVVGPAKTNQSARTNQPVGGSVPEVLEFGGAIRVNTDWSPSQKKWQRVRQVRIQARPYMGPALAAEADKFPSLWGTGR